MQDRKAPVFVAATCNNVTVLPPELIRKGRFDEIFFVDLPNHDERRAILTAQLKRRKQNPADFDLDRLSLAAGGYSGAEIEAAIKSAMYAAFSEKKALKTETILQEISSTTPLSVTRAEDIEALRRWAADRARPATTSESSRAAAAQLA
jgi:SpoVK/Ycf46/Vps4 family AAA+-type ATPase